MRCFTLTLVLLGLGLCGMTWLPAAPTPPMDPRWRDFRVDSDVVLHRVPGNLIQNSSFEHDWYNRRFAEQRRFLLLQASDMGVGEADGHVDHWRFEGAAMPGAWDTEVSRAGRRSVRFDQGGRGWQLLRAAGEQNWQPGGAYYAEFLRLARPLALQIPKRPIVVGGWCRTQNVPAGGEPTLSVKVECGARQDVENRQAVDMSQAEAGVAFSAGTHDWEYREVRVAAEQLKGTPFFITVNIASPGKVGRVWFDDLACVEPMVAGAGLLANPGFESLEGDGWTTGWQRPARWTWVRSDYYTFTGWWHGETKRFRGGAEVDPVIAYSGRASMRFQVFPGDQFAVESAPVVLNQPHARPVEVRAMVRADRLRTLEIMAKDESGDWLPQGDFLGDDMENNPGTYNMGTTGSGTYDWQCIRKYFSPRRPLKSLRLFLCARGFDGVIVPRNVVGTVWFDDVQLVEHGRHDTPAPAGSPGSPAAASDPPVRVVDIDLGERLWGKNRAQLLLELADAAAARQVADSSLRLELSSPSGAARTFPGRVEILQPPLPGRSGYAAASGTYYAEQLCRSWEEQYRLSLRLERPGSRRLVETKFTFGTPSELAPAGVSAHYAYPGEEVVAWANLNVAPDSFGDLSRCEIVLKVGGEERRLAELRDFSGLRRPQTGPDYLDTHQLLETTIKGERLTTHPWTEPTRDSSVSFRIYSRTDGREELLAASEPVAFGFMEPVPKAELPNPIRRTGVDSRGFIRVNDRPFFPVYWTPHFGISPEGQLPAAALRRKSGRAH